jgi:spermidine synthase
MIPWQLLDAAESSGGEELKLFRRGDDFAIRIGHLELMTSRTHGSEEELAALACEPLAGRPDLRVLVGGLGMGFTLAAALARVPPGARVEVSELLPSVVDWNRTHLAHLAGRPLDDERVTVQTGDMAELLRSSSGRYDAIMNDVDNGPDGLLLAENRWLYSPEGLEATYAALRPGGILTVWSVGPDRSFTPRLTRVGFKARSVTLRDRGGRRGRRHTIWIANRI